MFIKESKKIPLVSGILVIINVIVFLVCTFTGDLLYNIGKLSLEGVLLDREYGRILLSLFLHGDFEHIFNNMVILFFLGAMIESEIGHIRYALVYFISGIGGNLVSFAAKMFTGDAVGSIGASGAIFGLDGVLAALMLFSGKKMANVTPVRVVLMIGYSLYAGFVGENVDNAAHLGGLLIGFAAGSVLCLFDARKTLD